MSANLKYKSTAVRERVSKEEWAMRVDLAAAYQLGAIYKWTDLIYTHFSARIPGTEDFLLNPYGLMFDEINASSLVKVDWDGKIIDDPLGMGVNEAGFVIHSCIHRARPEVNCVIHTHTRAGVAVSARKCGLLPISPIASVTERSAASIMAAVSAAIGVPPPKSSFAPATATDTRTRPRKTRFKRSSPPVRPGERSRRGSRSR